jgi:acylphosphatase
MKIRAHIVVIGRVQGVFFRTETRHEAKKHGVTGWVRNLRHGGVEAVFEGEEVAVKELIEFCKRGPSGARVTCVDVKRESYIDEFKDFQIRYSF